MLHQKTILPGADHFTNMYYVDFFDEHLSILSLILQVKVFNP